MPVDTAEPEWLQTARAKGLVVSEGPPVAGNRATPPPRKPTARIATAAPEPTPPAPWAVEFVIDYAPRNESNIGGGLRAKIGRKATAKRASDAGIPAAVLALMPVPVLVTMTRVGGSKRMDDDGLATSMKFVRDRIAHALGVDDGDTARVRFRVRQRPGYGRSRVLVRVEPRSG